MKIIEPSFEILSITDPELLLIERAGRVCYRSEDRIEPGSAERFTRMVIGRHHESVIEHGSMSVLFTFDRGVSHELVRHRHTSPSQESTRYCNYSKGKFDGELSFVRPFFFDEGGLNYAYWEFTCRTAEEFYLAMLANGAKPEEARTVLPSSLATTMVVTANFREWRHMFRERTARAAHPQMRQVMCPLLEEARRRVPVVFDDVGVVEL